MANHRRWFRNFRMVSRMRAGETSAEVGAAFGLHPSGVRQIRRRFERATRGVWRWVPGTRPHPSGSGVMVPCWRQEFVGHRREDGTLEVPGHIAYRDKARARR